MTTNPMEQDGVVVPREPTAEMIVAAVRVWDSSPPDPEQLECAAQTWAAMLAAAPAPEAQALLSGEPEALSNAEPETNARKAALDELIAESQRLGLYDTQPEALGELPGYGMPADVAELRKMADSLREMGCNRWASLTDEAAYALAARDRALAEARRDGERWRYARRFLSIPEIAKWDEMRNDGHIGSDVGNRAADAAIDAAIEQEKGNG